YLDRVDVERKQEFYGSNIKRRADAHQSHRTGRLENRLMPLPWRMCFFIKLPKSPAIPQAIGVLDEKFRSASVDRQGRRCERLQLNCVGTAFSSCTHDSQRAF